MSALTTVKVGDTIHVRSEQGGRPKGEFRPFVVTKVGRVWIHAHPVNWPGNESKFSIADGTLYCGGYSPDHCAYIDPQAALDADAANAAWREFCRQVQYTNRPAHLSLADIQALRAKVRS